MFSWHGQPTQTSSTKKYFLGAKKWYMGIFELLFVGISQFKKVLLEWPVAKAILPWYPKISSCSIALNIVGQIYLKQELPLFQVL